jgi:hypothetical protein
MGFARNALDHAINQLKALNSECNAHKLAMKKFEGGRQSEVLPACMNKEEGRTGLQNSRHICMGWLLVLCLLD